MTVFAALSSYLCLPSFPAPVMNVIRIISERSRGFENAELMVVWIVDTEFPARSKVSLSAIIQYDGMDGMYVERFIIVRSLSIAWKEGV